MKNKIILLTFLLLCANCSVYAAKYKVNSSGTVKTNRGQVVQPVQQQNPYSVYNAQSYVNNNQVNINPTNIVEIVMDYSGSMYSWINEAKRTMASIVSQIPSTTNVGFRVFGHNYNGLNPDTSVLGTVKKIVKQNGKYKVQTKASPVGSNKGACAATTQVTKVSPINALNLLSGMNSVSTGGSTPLVYGLDRAINEDFVFLDRSIPKKIILITDGGENCGGNPCEYAKQLVQTRRDIHVDVVLVTNSFDSNLQCLASQTGGKLYRINDLSELLPTLTQSLKTVPTNTSQPIQTEPNQNYEYYND